MSTRPVVPTILAFLHKTHKPKSSHSTVEVLESRIAPAAVLAPPDVRDSALTEVLDSEAHSIFPTAEPSPTAAGDASVSVSIAPGSVIFEDGPTNLVFTFTRTGDTTASLVVNFSYSSSNLGQNQAADYSILATEGVTYNYATQAGTVTFGPGETTKTVTYDPTPDDFEEGMTNPTLSVSSGTGYQVTSPSTAMGVLQDDEQTIRLTSSTSNVTEGGAASVIYTFTRSGGTGSAATVNFNVGGNARFIGDGTFAADYTQVGAATFNNTTGTIVIPVGETTATVTLTAIDDESLEGLEIASLTIASGAYAIGGPSSASTNFFDNESATIAFTGAGGGNLAENSGDQLLNVTLTITANGVPNTGRLERPTTVSLASFQGDTAFAGSDYTLSSSEITFATGSVSGSQQFTVTIANDALVEGTERFNTALLMSDSAGGRVMLGNGTWREFVIGDNDRAVLRFATTSGTITEGNNPLGINAHLSIVADGTGTPELANAIYFDVTQVSGSPSGGGVDYSFSGQGRMPAGAGNGSVSGVSLSVVNDALVEGNESATLGMAIVPGSLDMQASVDPDASFALTINDNDSARIAFSQIGSSRGENPISNVLSLTLTITANGSGIPSLAVPVQVNISATGGSAEGSGIDFTLPSTLTFAVGSGHNATASGNFSIVNDQLVEGLENAFLGLEIVDPLSGRVTVSNSAGTHTMTIVDNDFATISLMSSSRSSAEGDEPIQLGVDLDFNTSGTGPVALAREVTFTLTEEAGGTAQAGLDFTLPATVAFAAGSGDDATQTLNLPVVDDSVPEAGERANFILSIVSDGTNGRVSAPTAAAVYTLAISDNDIDLKVTATGPVAPVVAGSGPDNLAFSFTVQNVGPTKATGIHVNDLFTLPAGATFSSAATSSGTTFIRDGSGGAWSIPVLDVNESVTLTVTFTAASAAAAGSTVTLSGSVVSADQTLGNVGDDSTTASGSIIRQADLALSMIDDADPVEVGAQITYTITVLNHGPSDATGASLTNIIPAGLAGATWTASLNGIPAESGSGDFDLLTAVPADGFIVVTVSGTVTAPGNTTLINTASITSSEDPNPQNNNDSESTSISGVDLKLTKTPDVESAQPGQVIKYTLTYRNGGLVAASGVNLTDLIPAHTVFDLANSTAGWLDMSGNILLDGAAAGTTVLFQIGSLPVTESGSSVVLAVRVLAVVTAGAETIGNSASIADNGVVGSDALPADNVASTNIPLLAAPDLQLSIVNDPLVAQRGGVVQYLLTYENVGNQDATGTFVTMTLPAHTIFDASNSTGIWTNIHDNVYRLDLGNVNVSDASQTSVFAVTLNTAIPGGYNALATSGTVENGDLNGPDPSLTNNTDTESTPIYQGIYAVSPASDTPRRGGLPVVRVFDIATGFQIHTIHAYAETYRGGIRIALGDINGDGFDDIITSTRTKNGQVRTFDGVTGDQFEGALAEIAAFPERGARGAFVASGDYNGDGRDDIIVGSGQGASGAGKVRVFDGLSGLKIAEFQPFAAGFRGGVRVATGDVNGDGVAEIIASQGIGGNDVVVTTGLNPQELLRLQVGGSRYRGGVSVAAADLDGDGAAEIIAGRNRGQTIVEIFSASGGTALETIVPFSTKYRLGARVAAADVNLDGVVDILIGAGAQGRSEVKVFDGVDYSVLRSFQAFPAHLKGAVFVTATAQVPSL